MDVGIRDARNNLSKLIASARLGEKIYLTMRGERVAEIVPASATAPWRRAYGMFRGKLNLYPGWDWLEEDKKIESTFEALEELDEGGR